jgi:pyridoxal phosphate enzyme (YggS family)
MTDIQENLKKLHERIDQAAARAGRSADEVELIAISKVHDEELLREAYQAGQTTFGESYVQEWQTKAENLSDLDIDWHFVGALQSNKVRYITDRVSVIHGINRKKLVKEVRKRAEKPQKVCIQVSVSGEESKSGCDPDDAPGIVRYAMESDNVVPIGLMTIPPHVEDESVARKNFRELRELRDSIREELASDYDMEGFTHLSMGMTNDFEIAIEEGATMIRVGTAIFGPRNYDD